MEYNGAVTVVMPKLSDFKYLTAIQKKVLTSLEGNTFFTDSFFFTGGTLLKALGIVPRESNDLDFFTFSHIEALEYTSLLKKVGDILKSSLGAKNLTPILKGFLHHPSGILIECIADSFPPLDRFLPFGRLKTAGLKDIAAHKTSALCSRDEMKDLIDLAFLTKKMRWSLKDLARFAEKKFQIGTMQEEKIFEELLSKKNMFSMDPELFLFSGENNVKMVNQQIDHLLTSVSL